MRTCVLRLCPAIAIALWLGACARDPYVSTTQTVASGNWKIEKQVDRVTGEPISSALLTTRTSSSSAVLFPGPASIQLMCLKDQPLVRIGFPLKVGSTRNASLGYRFDDKPGHEPTVRFVQDYQTVVMEDRAEVARFAGELASSKVLYLRIRSINYPRASAEFQVDGGQAAVDAAFASCPIAQPQPQPQRTATPPARRRTL